METDTKSDEGRHAQPGGEAAPAAGETRTPRWKRRGPPDEEHGGPVGPEPTRYGDWERKGIAKDF